MVSRTADSESAAWGEPEVDGEGSVHLHRPLTARVVGIALQNQMSLSFT